MGQVLGGSKGKLVLDDRTLAIEFEEEQAPHRRRRRRLHFPPGRKRGGYVGTFAALAPGGGFYLLAFAVPLGLLVAYSFFVADQFAYKIRPAFTVTNYKAVGETSLYVQLMLRTVELGLIVTAIVLVLGYAFAYIATFTFPRRRELLLFLMVVSIFGGYLVRIYAWRSILGNEGAINSVLQSAGIINHPLGFLLFNQVAVVIGLVNLLLPFGTLPLFSAMQNVPRDVIEAARDLGGGRLVVLRTILLPLTSTGLRIAFAFAFVLTCGDYVTPQLLGGTNGLMIGNAISDQFATEFNWPLGCALAIAILLIALAVCWLFSRLLRLAVR
jgi:spermidine/putrescine transport system permease protein